MDVLLIQPRVARANRLVSWQVGLVPPMMLLYLAHPLRERGFHTGILDLTVYDINRPRLGEYLRIHRPKIVGITTTTLTVSNALRIAEIIKQADNSARVVLGGPHATFQAGELLRNRCVDVVVRGEGDINFPQLVEHFLNDNTSLSEIKGISYRQEDKIVEHPRSIVKDVDALRFPLRDQVNLSRYKIPGSIYATRGCPCQCRFCSAGAISGGKYRARSIDSIKDELDYLVGILGSNYLLFSDNTITVFPETPWEICHHILKKGYRIGWVCESRVDVTDRKLLKLMARAGCQTIQYGFESGSSTILKAMNKKTTHEQIENAVNLTLEAGIRPTGNFMIGFPEETRETVRETVELGKKIKKRGAWVALSILTPYPGTYYYKRAEKIGLTVHSDNWEDFDMENPIISTVNFSLDELRRLYYDSKVELIDA
jgi:radical SAM superfamily enzyme YgiQ (UPF0313 family)